MSDAKSKPTTAPERKEKFTTLSGIPIGRLYTQESLAGWDPEIALSYPGEFPYTTLFRSRRR